VRMPADLPRRRPRGDGRSRGPRGRALLVVLAIALFVLLTSLRGIAGFYTDYLWFDSLGYRSVLTGVLGAKVSLAAIFSAGFFVLLWVNLTIADRLAPRLRPAGPEEEVIERYREMIGDRTGLVRVLISAVFGLVAGVGVSGQWNEWLLFTNAQDFGVDDPEFGVDAGFYVFKLPFLTYVVDWLFASLTIILLVTAVAHYVNGGIRVQGIAQRVTPQVKAHLSVLLGLLAVIKAADYYLNRFELTVSTRGTVDGALYTDVKAQLPALNLLLFISGVALVLFIVNIWRRGWVLPMVAVGLWAFVAIVVGTIYPSIIQRVTVEPSESSKERPYIERNIEATRYALGLTDVEARDFSADESLTAADLTNNADTVRNIRLWDPDTISRAYQRLQEVRRNYRIVDVDIDRYEIDGETRQVLVAARELDSDDLPQDSWEAKHLSYTSGHGLVAAPSNAKDRNGRPVFIAQDVPHSADVPSLELDEPSIYVGEGLSGYVMVKTEEDEIDFQDEDRTVYTSYDGEDGVGVGSYLRRAAFALRFADWNAFISGNVTSESKILIVRDVRERVEALAPFLSLDADPYVVNIDGRIKYVVDAYTTTSRFPYAQRVENGDLDDKSGLRHGFNYVRNSVKAVVDAYDGTVELYVTDDEDPLVRAYRGAFPELFSDAEDLPEELVAHFRYPEDLFRVQTNMWGRYHIEDPDDFYTRNDAWNVSEQPGAPTQQQLDAQGNPVGAATRQRIEPYYLQMKLPGEESAEFVLLRPFSPVSGDDSRQELTAFMVAKSDPTSFGQLEMFVTPRTDLPDGPGIVASTIRNDPVVGQLQTLLGQRGSELLFGNLVVVPIEESLLWVQPVYVQAEATRIPELERVIVSFEGEVAVEDTLEEALNAIFGDAPDTGEEAPGQDDGEEPDEPQTRDVEELLALASDAFEEAQAALDEGDLGEYQAKVEEAQGYVEEARALQGGGTTTTAPPDDTDEPEPEPEG